MIVPVCTCRFRPVLSVGEVDVDGPGVFSEGNDGFRGDTFEDCVGKPIDP